MTDYSDNMNIIKEKLQADAPVVAMVMATALRALHLYRTGDDRKAEALHDIVLEMLSLKADEEDAN